MRFPTLRAVWWLPKARRVEKPKAPSTNCIPSMRRYHRRYLMLGDCAAGLPRHIRLALRHE